MGTLGTFWQPALDAMALEVQRKEALRMAQMKSRLLQPEQPQETRVQSASTKTTVIDHSRHPFPVPPCPPHVAGPR
jgi:hypothetical protein